MAAALALSSPLAAIPRTWADAASPCRPLAVIRRRSKLLPWGAPCRRLPTTAMVQAGGAAGNEDEDGFDAGFYRGLPIWAGGVGGTSLLVNRLLSGTAAVADASSAQSRADVLGLAMAACLVLTGLQWKALEQRAPEQVALDGAEVLELGGSVPEEVADELRWCWEALRSATRCTSLVVFSGEICALKAGMVSRECAEGNVQPSVGPICDRALETGRGNYLANLVLFPGRAEFTAFLPQNTQGVVVQPVGEWGVMVAGTDTQRGFTRVDQAWIATLAEKLDVSLDDLGKGA